MQSLSPARDQAPIKNVEDEDGAPEGGSKATAAPGQSATSTVFNTSEKAYVKSLKKQTAMVAQEAGQEAPTADDNRQTGNCPSGASSSKDLIAATNKSDDSQDAQKAGAAQASCGSKEKESPTTQVRNLDLLIPHLMEIPSEGICCTGALDDIERFSYLLRSCCSSHGIIEWFLVVKALLCYE